MKVKYKILTINHEEHSIIVRYYTDILSEESLASDTNRNEDGTPVRCRTDYNITLFKYPATQEEIEATIKQNAPVQWLQLKEQQTNLHHIEHLIGKETEVEIDITSVSEEELTEEQIEELLSKLK